MLARVRSSRNHRRVALTGRLLALGMAVNALVAMHPANASPADIFSIGAPVIGSSPPKADEIHEGDASVSSQTGAALYSYPLDAPPGRLGMRPNLAISYSSQAPLFGGVAAGWSLSIPSITIDTERGRLGPWPTQYRSSMAGGRLLVQVSEPAANGDSWRAQGDNSFTRYQRVASSPNTPSTGYWWMALSSDGSQHYFGDLDHVGNCGSLISDSNAPLTRSVDAFGNAIDYWYTQGAAGECVISQITWGENANASIGAFAAITFTYSLGHQCAGIEVGSTTSFRTGQMLVSGASRLDTIMIMAFPPLAYSASGYTVPQTVDHTRLITLGYDAAAATGNSGQTSCFRQLDSIQESAWGGPIVINGTAIDSPRVDLPAVMFGYGPAALAYPAETAGSGVVGTDLGNGDRRGYGNSWPTVDKMYVDVDGDGRVDVLEAYTYTDNSRVVFAGGARTQCAAVWYKNWSDTQGNVHYTQMPTIPLPTLKWLDSAHTYTGGSAPFEDYEGMAEGCALNYQYTGYRNQARHNYCCQADIQGCPTPDSTYAGGTCTSGYDCWNPQPQKDTTLAYRWVDLDGDGLVDLVASVATSGYYNLQHGAGYGFQTVCDVNAPPEPAIFGTWSSQGAPTYPFPPCPSTSTLSPGMAALSEYTMCGGLYPWFFYKNHGNGVFRLTDTTTGYAPLPDAIYYQPIPLETQGADSSVWSAPAGQYQALTDIDGDGYPDGVTWNYASYQVTYNSTTGAFYQLPIAGPIDGTMGVFRNAGNGRLVSATTILPYSFPATGGDLVTDTTMPPPDPYPDVPASISQDHGLLDLNQDGLVDHWRTPMVNNNQSWGSTEVEINLGNSFTLDAPNLLVDQSTRPGADGRVRVGSTRHCELHDDHRVRRS